MLKEEWVRLVMIAMFFCASAFESQHAGTRTAVPSSIAAATA
jgi:hypothetical protein